MEVSRKRSVASNGPGPGSFDAFYRDQWAPAVRLAWAMTGSRATGEDLAQDAFLRLQRVWPEVAEPVAYLRRSVINGTRNAHRRRLVEMRHRPGPAHPVLPAEVDETLGALRRLSSRQRQAIALRYYEDFTIPEVAEWLGCPLGTAKSLVNRGLAALRKELHHD